MKERALLCPTSLCLARLVFLCPRGSLVPCLFLILLSFLLTLSQSPHFNREILVSAASPPSPLRCHMFIRIQDPNRSLICCGSFYSSRSNTAGMQQVESDRNKMQDRKKACYLLNRIASYSLKRVKW